MDFIPEVRQIRSSAEFPNAKEKDRATCDGVSSAVSKGLGGERSSRLMQVIR